MLKPKFSAEYVVDIDRCGPCEKLGVIGTFNILQSLATGHAFRLGIGAFDTWDRGGYWVVTNTQVEFYNDVNLYETLVGETWPMPTEEKAFKMYRSYTIIHGKELIAKAKSEWVVLSTKNNMPVPFRDSGFPKNFKYCKDVAIEANPTKFVNDFEENDQIGEYVIQVTDIDLAVHTNNVKYIQIILNTFTLDEMTKRKVKSFEVKYAASCLLGDKVKIYRKVEDNTYRYAIKNDQGKVMTYALIEFKN
ncbi:MAG: thioesterase [Bacilli bacterium]|nr:thioesterase [Bacilli bacterium]